jgi:hypothetical protein
MTGLQVVSSGRQHCGDGRSEASSKCPNQAASLSSSTRWVPIMMTGGGVPERPKGAHC